MYLLEGPYNTTMLAPRYPEGYKGGYVYAGNYRLMHKLCISAQKVILRPNGVLAFPERYSRAMAIYDRSSNEIEVPRKITARNGWTSTATRICPNVGDFEDLPEGFIKEVKKRFRDER